MFDVSQELLSRFATENETKFLLAVFRRFSSILSGCRKTTRRNEQTKLMPKRNRTHFWACHRLRRRGGGPKMSYRIGGGKWKEILVSLAKKYI